MKSAPRIEESKLSINNKDEIENGSNSSNNSNSNSQNPIMSSSSFSSHSGKLLHAPEPLKYNIKVIRVTREICNSKKDVASSFFKNDLSCSSIPFHCRS